MKVVLLTGATGVLGSVVAPRFLDDADTELRLLLRADSALEAGPFEKLDFVSTLGVAGTRRGHVPETADLGPRRFHNTKELGRRVRDQLDGHARPRTRQVPLPVFTGMVRALKPILRGRALANLSLLPDHLNADQRFENGATLGLLGAAGITVPRVEDYLEHVLGYYKRSRRP